MAFLLELRGGLGLGFGLGLVFHSSGEQSPELSDRVPKSRVCRWGGTDASTRTFPLAVTRSPVFSLTYFLLLYYKFNIITSQKLNKGIFMIFSNVHVEGDCLAYVTLSQWKEDFCFCNPPLSSAFKSRTADSNLRNKRAAQTLMTSISTTKSNTEEATDNLCNLEERKFKKKKKSEKRQKATSPSASSMVCLGLLASHINDISCSRRSEKAKAVNSSPPNSFLNIGCKPSWGRSLTLLIDSLDGFAFVLVYSENAFEEGLSKPASSADDSMISRTLSDSRSMALWEKRP
ncbi:ubiquitin carboxyl-terminal hydrolase 46 [Striga asiatica]|uniref:Ubiquitin carboxyl-terminal hydrolase 46 n=1 Tax=Striga asiatica TaxID=4170 RepID=A0A5A7Q0T2_STRAF|nr:ubiquitin carboxyl-terminal hydrolase 46 [Striga asiatica]